MGSVRQKLIVESWRCNASLLYHHDLSKQPTDLRDITLVIKKEKVEVVDKASTWDQDSDNF